MTTNPSRSGGLSPASAALGRLATLSLALLLVACGGGVVTSEVPTATTTVTSAPTPAAPTFVPAPSGHLAVPSEFEIELVPGRYWSSPPFNVGFSFVVDQPGWIAGHLNPEFFDIQRDADGGGPEWPQSMLAFGLPEFVRGSTNIPDTELTPAEAVTELVGRASLGATNVTELTLFGLPAVRVDLHTAVQSPVFGGADGTFTVGPQLDARLVFVPFEDGLLAVIVQGAAGDLEARWLEALPILNSVDLP